jgi:flagellar biosynthesis component FlhA
MHGTGGHTNKERQVGLLVNLAAGSIVTEEKGTGVVHSGLQEGTTGGNSNGWEVGHVLLSCLAAVSGALDTLLDLMSNCILGTYYPVSPLKHGQGELSSGM